MNFYKQLLESISGIKIIDAHELLYSERERINAEVDVFTLFGHYVPCDLDAAGMAVKDILKLQDKTVALDERWRMFEPYWQKIQFTGYSRAVWIAIQKFCECDD